MLVSNRFNMKSKAALGLLVTVFVAAACSHNNLKDAAPEEKDTPEVSADQELPPSEPVTATGPGTFEQSNTEEVAPAPVFANEPDANPDSGQAPVPKKAMHHRKSRRSQLAAHKAARKTSHRRHKKLKKVAKNHRSSKVKEFEQAPGAAMGSVSQLPPPPPPTDEMLPPPPPPPPAPQFNGSPVDVTQADASGSNTWIYIAIFSVAVLIGLGVRYRSLFAKKSRRLVYAK